MELTGLEPGMRYTYGVWNINVGGARDGSWDMLDPSGLRQYGQCRNCNNPDSCPPTHTGSFTAEDNGAAVFRWYHHGGHIQFGAFRLFKVGEIVRGVPAAPAYQPQLKAQDFTLAARIRTDSVAAGGNTFFNTKVTVPPAPPSNDYSQVVPDWSTMVNHPLDDLPNQVRQQHIKERQAFLL